MQRIMISINGAQIENAQICFLPLVSCKWGEWKLGECSKDCGSGMRTDFRDIEIKAAHGGIECEGESNITENCNNHECPGIIEHITYMQTFSSEISILVKIRICNLSGLRMERMA